MNPQALEQESRNSLQKGSKSFHLASLLFSKNTYRDVTYLYAWCRYCDDVTDGSVLGFDQNPIGLLPARVDSLKTKTKQAVSGTTSGLEAPFLAFGTVARKYGIPLVYAEDLLAGMEHDAEKRPILTHSDLLRYCYQVAGTVGLMMCHIMGIKNTRALTHAVHLGIALQLTNIARDIGDDFRVGKIYLPLQWLEEENLTQVTLLHPESSERLNRLVQRILKEADSYYQSGLDGLTDLPWRPALAVAVAAQVYRGIGTRVLELGPVSRHSRVVVRLGQKVKALAQGFWLVFKTFPERFLKPRRSIPIQEIWRYS